MSEPCERKRKRRSEWLSVHSFHLFHTHLLWVDAVGLVEDHADFVFAASQGGDAAQQFVGDVELVDVEEEQDAVDALGEPLQDADEVVAAFQASFRAGEDAWRVHETHAFQQLRVYFGDL